MEEQSIQGVVPGGLQEVPVDDADIIRLSQIGLTKLNEGLTAEPRKLVEIVKAYRQVVAGTLTHLTLRISERDALKECEIKIWEQPWLNKTEITHMECKDVAPSSKK